MLVTGGSGFDIVMFRLERGGGGFDIVMSRLERGGSGIDIVMSRLERGVVCQKLCDRRRNDNDLCVFCVWGGRVGVGRMERPCGMAVWVARGVGGVGCP